MPKRKAEHSRLRSIAKGRGECTSTECILADARPPSAAHVQEILDSDEDNDDERDDNTFFGLDIDLLDVAKTDEDVETGLMSQRSIRSFFASSSASSSSSSVNVEEDEFQKLYGIDVGLLEADLPIEEEEELAEVEGEDDEEVERGIFPEEFTRLETHVFSYIIVSFIFSYIIVP